MDNFFSSVLDLYDVMGFIGLGYYVISPIWLMYNRMKIKTGSVGSPGMKLICETPILEHRRPCNCQRNFHDPSAR